MNSFRILLKNIDYFNILIGIILLLTSIFLIFSSLVLGNAGGFSGSGGWFFEGLAIFLSGLVHLIVINKINTHIKRLLAIPVLTYGGICILSRVLNEFSQRTYNFEEKIIGYVLITLSFLKVTCLVMDWIQNIFEVDPKNWSAD